MGSGDNSELEGLGRRTVGKEDVEKAEMVRVGDVEEVVGTGLAEGGPIDYPPFAAGASAAGQGDSERGDALVRA